MKAVRGMCVHVVHLSCVYPVYVHFYDLSIQNLSAIMFGSQPLDSLYTQSR